MRNSANLSDTFRSVSGMPRAKSSVTKAKLRRAIAAAREEGAAAVEVKPDGSVIIHLCATPSQFSEADIAGAEKIIL